MKRSLFAVLVVTCAIAIVPAALASITITPSTVGSGGTFSVSLCVATAGDGGYLLVKGPNTFSEDLFFGPVAGCSTVPVSTPGWVAGKYRVTAFEFTAKGTKSLGTATLT